MFQITFDTSIFVVTNPEKFKKEFSEKFNPNSLNFEVTEHGFGIYGDDVTSDDVEQTAIIIRDHLKEGMDAHIRCLCWNDLDSQSTHSFYYITPLTIAVMECKEIFSLLKRNAYPRMIECNTSCQNKETNTWIEKGVKYKALNENKLRGRPYYLIEVKDGHQVTWGKEYFND